MSGTQTAPATVRRAQSHVASELDRTNWPIAAGMLPFPPAAKDGTSVRDLGPGDWADSFRAVADLGFEHAELTDTWLRVGDLAPGEIEELGAAARAARVSLPAVALIRGSVIDPRDGLANLAYSHRSIDAAVALGADVVSVGLHEPLTDVQREVTWFWTRPGATNDPADAAQWDLAVQRLTDLGRHAEEVGVLLALEMYEDTYLGTAESTVQMVEEIGMDVVGINPDLGNLIRLNRPIERWDEALAKVLPFTNYWHVKNYTRLEDPDRGIYLAAPSSMEHGLINYRRAFRDAIDAGFAGVITCEHYGGDGLGVMASNRRYITTLLPPGNEENPT
jgi:sugar phosphate isomerase/epimerase